MSTSTLVAGIIHFQRGETFPAAFYLAAFGSFLESAALSKTAGFVLIADAVVALYLSAP